MKITRTQLYLERLELVILIGIHDFEQTRPQRVHVDVEMEVDPADMAFADDLSQGVDYDFVRDGIKQLVTERRYKTQDSHPVPGHPRPHAAQPEGPCRHGAHPQAGRLRRCRRRGLRRQRDERLGIFDDGGGWRPPAPPGRHQTDCKLRRAR